MVLKTEERKMIAGKLIYLAVSYQFLSNKVNMKKNKDAFYGTQSQANRGQGGSNRG